jgi:hypothetical protein
LVYSRHAKENLLTTLAKSVGRNDPCRCGSGKKYKQCCLDKDEAAARKSRAKEMAEAPAPEAPAETPPAQGRARPRPPAAQPWKRGAQNTRGFHKVTTPRKVGGG